MRTPSILFLASVAVPSTALAQASGTPSATSSDASAEPPARVLEHTLDVTVSGGNRLSQTQTWVVQIDDPEACAAGLRAPDGLHGAMDGGAQVLEEYLLVPSDTAAGTVFSLTATTSEATGPYSGVFSTAPDLPTDFAEVTVKAPSWVPLHTWADDAAHPQLSRGKTRRASYVWTEVPAGHVGQLVWSTWSDWGEAEDQLMSVVQPKLIPRKSLGREIGSDLDGSSLPVLVDRVNDYITLVPGPPQPWSAARDGSTLLKERSGTAVDRGIVLISLLRAGGYDARPTQFRPATGSEAPPATLPAPSMLTRPLIVVKGDEKTFWLDPAAEKAPVRGLPASLVNATVWSSGDVPHILPGNGVVNGTAVISTFGTIGADGSVTWSSNINVTGTAAEHLRVLLSPLDENGRQDALLRLAQVSRPELERFTVQATGVEDPKRPLTITLGGKEEGAFAPLGLGLEGSIRPTLGPAMAAWLPPSILVREQMSVQPPAGKRFLTGQTPPSAYRPEAILSRDLERDGPKAILTWEALRPYETTTPARDEQARAFLHEHSSEGTKLILMAPVTGQVAASVRKSDELSTGESAVVEALAWWGGGVDPKAKKILKKVYKRDGLDAILEPLLRLAPDKDPTPWKTLDSFTELSEDRLKLVEGYASRGLTEEAWLLAARLATLSSGEVLVESLLWMDQAQPDSAPSGEESQEGAAAWKPRQEILEQASQAWEGWEGRPTEKDPRILIRQAELKLEEGAHVEAETLVDEAMALAEEANLPPSEQAYARVLGAQAAAFSGVAMSDVVDRIESAVRDVPFDVRVVTRAADSLAAVGDVERALDYALTAAWLDSDSAYRWGMVVDRALIAGDLGTAGFAARRASDLDPDDAELGASLSLIATLQHDEEGAALGRSRAGEPTPASWPPSVDEMMGLAPPDALLAVLNFHDHQVTSNPIHLGLRAQLRIDNGQLDGAARDAHLLVSRYDNDEGAALRFAATVGRIWSSTAEDELDAAAERHPLARMTRMEHRLVAGTDPTYDAQAMSDDPRAQIVSRTASDPASVAAELEGWPADLEAHRVDAPAGFRTNTLLSKPAGLRAFGDPERAVSVVYVNGITGLLPPPLGNLYTPASPPVESLDDGGQILKLQGGIIPLYAAFGISGGQEVITLGHTPGAARHALTDATSSQ